MQGEIRGKLEKIHTESADSKNPDKIVEKIDQKKKKWSFFEKPMSKILDKYKSHKHLHYEKCCHSFGNTVSCHKKPKRHNRMSHDESHKKLKNEHKSKITCLWHLAIFHRRKITHPLFSDRSHRIVPDPSKHKENCSSTDQDSTVSKWSKHERKEVHRKKVKNKLFHYRKEMFLGNENRIDE